MARDPRILRNVAVLYASEIGAKVVLVVFFFLLTTHLGPERYGQYAYALAFANLFAIVMDPGVMALVPRDVAAHRSSYPTYLWHAVFLKPLLLAIAAVGIAGALWATGTPPELFPLVVLAGTVVALETTNGLLRSFLQAFERMERIAIPRLLEKICLLALAAVLAAAGAGTTAFLGGTAAIAGVSLLVTVVLLHRALPSAGPPTFAAATARRLLRDAAPFSLFILFNTLYLNTDSVMLGRLVGDTAVGWYNAAYQPILALYAIAWLLMTALTPVIARHHADGRSAELHAVVAAGIRFLLLVGLPLGGGILATADRIVPFLFGRSYAPAIPALRVLAGVLILALLNFALANVLNATHRAHASLRATGFGVIVNISVNLVAIPWAGGVGAAVATLCTEGVVFALLARALARTMPVARMLRVALPIAALAVGVTALARALAGLPLGVTVAVTAVAYIAAARTVGLITAEDLRALRTLTTRTSAVTPIPV